MITSLRGNIAGQKQIEARATMIESIFAIVDVLGLGVFFENP